MKSLGSGKHYELIVQKRLSFPAKLSSSTDSR
jgi:hypothetical protein